MYRMFRKNDFRQNNGLWPTVPTDTSGRYAGVNIQQQKEWENNCRLLAYLCVCVGVGVGCKVLFPWFWISCYARGTRNSGAGWEACALQLHQLTFKTRGEFWTNPNPIVHTQTRQISRNQRRSNAAFTLGMISSIFVVAVCNWCQSSLAIDSSERPFAQESSQLERSRRWRRTRKQSIRKENGMISINQSQQNMASYLEGGNLDWRWYAPARFSRFKSARPPWAKAVTSVVFVCHFFFCEPSGGMWALCNDAALWRSVLVRQPLETWRLTIAFLNIGICEVLVIRNTPHAITTISVQRTPF